MNGVANQADVLAIERSNPRLPHSTYEMIGQAAAANPQSPALSFFLRTQEHTSPQTWDYASLFARITASANFFHSLGLKKEDVIAFVLPNLPETHLTLWGGQASGIVFAINPLLEPDAIADLLMAGEAKVLVTLAPFSGTDLLDKLKPVLGRVPCLQHLVLVNLAASGQQGGQLPLANLEHEVRHFAPALVLHDFSAAIATQPGDRLLSQRRFSPEDLSSYFCTGGTTGTPKIAMRTHGNEVSNAWSAGQVLGDGICAGKTLFCGLPMFHVNAVLITGLLPFSRGAHVLLGTPQGFRGDGVIARFWEMVAHHRVNFFSGVPTLYAALLQYPTAGHDLSSLEFGLCGAAPMPQQLMSSFQERTGLKILEGYGLTEGTCVSTVNPPLGKQRQGSIGLRVPLQNMKAAVLNEAGAWVRDCESGEVGVLLIRGANVFAGYKVPEHNQGIWIASDGNERWLNTGDLGRQDADGYFYLTGRKKELIIRSGHNIDPAQIEEPLNRHPAVQLVAAIGRPDEHAGEVPVAYVQLKPGFQTDEASLIEFARSHIGERAAVPKAIRIVQSMPLTAVGKIFKPELKLYAIEEALRERFETELVSLGHIRALQDPQRGTVLQVRLGRPDGRAAAERILGQFPYPFTVEP